MQPTTLLLRQVHPSWVKDGHVLSIAFRPFPKDEGLLSAYNGDQIQPESSWSHFTRTLGYASAGVWAVNVAEVTGCDLTARPDPVENSPHHAVIDFRTQTDKAQKAKAKILATKAEARGCLFLAPVA